MALNESADIPDWTLPFQIGGAIMLMGAGAGLLLQYKSSRNPPTEETHIENITNCNNVYHEPGNYNVVTSDSERIIQFRELCEFSGEVKS